MDISEAIKLTIYPQGQLSTIMMFFMKNYSEHEHSKLYLTSRDKGKIFMGRHNIPVVYSNNNYFVDILVYYPQNFLFSGPEFFFENKPNLGISPEYADVSVDMKDLKINIEFFMPWNQNTKNLEEIINFLKITFDETFPCFNQNSSDSKFFSGLCNFSPSQAIQINLDNKKNNVKTNFYGVPMNSSKPNNNNNNNPNLFYNNKNNNPNNYNNNNQNSNNNLYNKGGKNPSSYNNNNFKVNNQNNFQNKNISSFNENDLKNILRREIMLKIKNDKILETQVNDMISSKNEIKFLTNNIKNTKEENVKNIDVLKNNLSNVDQLLKKFQSLEESLNKDIEELRRKDAIPISLVNINEYISNYNENKLKYISYELTLNEYIATFKKLLEKGILNFQDAVFKIRRYSREIFTIKLLEFKANN